MRQWAWNIYLEGKRDKCYYERELQVMKNLDKRINKIESKKQQYNELESLSSLAVIKIDGEAESIASSIKEKIKDVINFKRPNNSNFNKTNKFNYRFV